MNQRNSVALGILVFLLLLLGFGLLLKTPEPVNASCDESTYKLTVRDDDGLFIPDINFKVYEQFEDNNGNIYFGDLVKSGSFDELGMVTFHLAPEQNDYIIKMYEKNQELGVYNYYLSDIYCAQKKELNYTLSSLSVIVKDNDGNILKDRNISVYTQTLDAKANPQKGDLILTKNTGSLGKAIFYLGPDNSLTKEKEGVYVISFLTPERVEYSEYDIRVQQQKDYLVEYLLSDVIFTVTTAQGMPFKAGTYISVYEQDYDALGNIALKNEIKNLRLDESGKAWMQYPSGTFVVTVSDSFDKEIIFDNVKIEKSQRNEISLQTNFLQFIGTDSIGRTLPEETEVKIYPLSKIREGQFKKNTALSRLRLDEDGRQESILRSGPYLFTVTQDKKEYGQALYVEQGEKYALNLIVRHDFLIEDDEIFYIKEPGSVKQSENLSERLKGYILLQVEADGQAWYVKIEDQKRYYMKDGSAAYRVMRDFGLGISDRDLDKIPVGIEERFVESDIDGDGLHDKLEEALGTNVNNPDTDGDGFNDGTEIKNNFSPLGRDAINIEKTFAEKLRGRILLQVESRGEAWYVNPADNKRYYMKDGDSAYQIMKFLSLGITNANLEKISVGSF